MGNRRSFVKKIVAGSVVLQGSSLMAHTPWSLSASWNIGKKLNQKVRIGLIGKGTMGTSNVNTALKVAGAELVAVCDLYDHRIDQVDKEWGSGKFTTKEYRALLERSDVDAVIVATPDHWHRQIAMDAMAAGKHVYCEKPIIHQLEEGHHLIQSEKENQSLFQMGSQGMASMGNRAARKIVESGLLGKINFVEGKYSRSPRSLYEFKTPADASKDTIWWDRFIGDAPMRSFDAQRFLEWRHWRDYSTGLAGDLFVHVISSVHYIMNTLGPEKVYTTGGIHHHTDGSRDTPDIMLALMDYPDRDNVGAFKMSLGANYVDGVSKNWASMDFDIIGDKGSINVGWNKVVLKSLLPIAELDQDKIKEIGQFIGQVKTTSENELTFSVNAGYKGGHYDHWNKFISSIQGEEEIIANSTFGVRASAAALLSYKSYETGKSLNWDAVRLKES